LWAYPEDSDGFLNVMKLALVIFRHRLSDKFS